MYLFDIRSLVLLWTFIFAADGLKPRDASAACSSIAKTISRASKVYYAASTNYVTDQQHYMSSSSQASTCVVEVGSTSDTAAVMKIIGSTRTPFAVRSGGHASNPGFSSTPGVLISLNRLTTIAPSADKKSVVLGMGNIWTNVYPVLNPLGYNVVGGRVTGPGTGGFTLGGGFSWLTNQYGLTCDNVQSYTLVLPNGTVAEIKSSTQPDLSFALKGGMNRFGILTQVTYNLYPQVPKVYGGYQVFASTEIPALLNATQQFSQTNKDPKAQIITTLNTLAGVPEGVLLLFYDGPIRPPQFAPFQSIPALSSDISSRSFSSLATSSPSQSTKGTRGTFHTLSTTGLTAKFLTAIYNETTFYGTLALLHTGVFISYDIEPFLKSYGSFATDSAYPHSTSPLPLNLYFAWALPSEDALWRGRIQDSVNHLLEVAKAEGIYDAGLTAYPNYALGTYTGEQLYGEANVARLRSIKAEVDPKGVMDLTGGFTF